MYLFYTRQLDGSARVESIYQDHEVSEDKKVLGFHLAGELPNPGEEKEGFDQVLYLNPETGDLWFRYEEREGNTEVSELRRRLSYAEDRLKTPDERYRSTNKEDLTLEEMKVLKNEQLKELHDRSVAEGFVSTSLGYTFGYEAKDRENIQKQVLLFIADPTKADCTWRTKDAGVVSLLREQFLGIVPEAEQHEREHVTRLWTLNAQVASATTKAEVDAVNW